MLLYHQVFIAQLVIGVVFKILERYYLTVQTKVKDVTEQYRKKLSADECPTPTRAQPESTPTSYFHSSALLRRLMVAKMITIYVTMHCITGYRYKIRDIPMLVLPIASFSPLIKSNETSLWFPLSMVTKVIPNSTFAEFLDPDATIPDNWFPNVQGMGIFVKISLTISVLIVSKGIDCVLVQYLGGIRALKNLA